MILLANLTNSPLRESIREKLETGRRLLAELIEVGQQRGEIRTDMRAIEMARAFHQAVFGTLLMWSLAPDQPLERRMESTMTILWTGISQKA